MNPKRVKKLYWIAGILLVSTAITVLLIYALNENINLFFTPSQIALQEAPIKSRIRIGGMVEKGSVIRKEGVKVEFVVTDFKHTVKIEYNGVLPDLFREGQGVVAMGRLVSKDLFLADQILAKHDEKYMPPMDTRNMGQDEKKGSE